MALALTVDSLDSVPEAFRGAYVADGDKFKLDAELPDDSGLKSALQKEREARKVLEKDIAGWKRLGKSADEIAELVAAQEAEGTEKLKKKGDFDALLKQHQDGWGKEKSTLEKKLEGANAAARAAIVDASVTTALTKAKVTQEGLDLLTDRLGKRIKLEIGDDGEREIQIMQADGKTPLAGKGADGTATFEDLVEDAKKTFPSLFEGTGAGGSGASNKGGKPGDKTIARADFDKLSPMDKQSKVRGGFAVVD